MKDSVNKQADAVKQSAAAAMEDLKSQVGSALLLAAALHRQQAQHIKIAAVMKQSGLAPSVW